ncbi:SDR family NAD(P)-dependent oxidoreductase [Nocardia sp. alder85J]|uniref:SDR family NAD(P)-dependent oxidoreductase n=1 Tax=Nocardia sp. alder85J TaxID=2862949 RepID=UPI001CD694C3|nr:SDR family NAD(P)-dependent oxidoreductase [Nocardia sp. alder85J]MCX4092516.1 SDR family NAD(P)-dependent oxidoreductase [Nocardia sp. alder85J]
MTGRTAIVTGGAAGIGGAVSRRLAADGALVAIFDLNGDAARAAAESIEDAGGKAIGLAVDVSDRAALDAAVTEVRARLGRPAILVTSAGITVSGPFLDISADTWNKVQDINFGGTFHSCQAVLPDMIEQGWGRIVTISSSSIHTCNPGLAAYVSSKWGVVGLTKVLALEFAKHGITVNTVPPGFIETQMMRDTVERGFIDLQQQIDATPVGRVGQPEDVANACAFLISDEASYITGQVIDVAGGRTI